MKTKIFSLLFAILANATMMFASFQDDAIVVFSEPFSSSQGNFTIENKILPSASSYVWKWKSADYGMAASAYISGTSYAAESWLISPSISLANYSTATLSFYHAVNKGTPTNLKVKISTDDGSTWSDLSISQWPEGTNWTFQNATASLDAYVGNTIMIAFAYISYASNCPTWEIKSFRVLATQEENNLDNDVQTGVFSVSADKKIYFSPGNLQYNATLGTHQCSDGTTQQGTWRFAENQWDIVKKDNDNASATYDGWIDLFAWGTSGYNEKYPYLKNDTYGDSYFICDSTDIAGTNYDWGVYNDISNGESNSTWRLPTADEYNYILTGRPNAENLIKTNVSVNGVSGFVLYPDDWDLALSNPSSYTAEAWEQAEEAGAVFFPYAGVRNYGSLGGTSWFFVGYYWTSTYGQTSGKAYALDVVSTYGVNEHPIAQGRAVRLVREVYTIRWFNYDGTELEIDKTVEFGSMPEYNGEIPTRPATEQYTYTFKGWTPEIVTVTGDAIYTAVYDSTAIVKETGGFSVSADKKIYFSPGNLQYQASSGSWRFAEHQWDYVGNATLGTVYENDVKCNNELISDTYVGWIDLFGRGTGDNPTLHSTISSDYVETFDWGLNISTSENNWRTLTANEWDYLTTNRDNASDLLGSATVNDVHGYIILPDDWYRSEGLTFNSGSNDWTNNVYSIEQWNMMEEAGAVFLPATGYRNGTICDETQSDGHYWSIDNSHWWYNCYSQFMQTRDAYSGRAVRLVQDVTNAITAIEDIRENSDTPTKLLHNGQILILRGDKTYTLTGQEVK